MLGDGGGGDISTLKYTKTYIYTSLITHETKIDFFVIELNKLDAE